MFPLVVYENKRAEIDGILVGKGNIFLSGSTSAALGKCKKPHRLMVKIKEETYATEQGVRNGKNKRGNPCNRTRRWKTNWSGETVSFLARRLVLARHCCSSTSFVGSSDHLLS